MKHKRAIIVGVAIVAYLALAVLFFQGYRGYLKRPSSGAWDQVNGMLLDPAVYHGEPVTFEPDWLRHYATDWGRLAGVRIRSSPGDAPVWWLVTDRTPDIDDLIVLEARRFETVQVLKLQVKSMQDGGR